MNMEYRILWIEDSDDYVDATIKIIENKVKENNMNPVIKTYLNWIDYETCELINFDVNSFNQYDLIIIDCALSGDKTGDEIIRDIRRREIFTDIIFYSSNYNKMKNQIRNSDHIDGIFCADREYLPETVNNVIKKKFKT